MPQEKIIVEFEIDAGLSKEKALEMIKSVEGVNDAQEQLNDTIDETDGKVSELSQGIDKMTGGAISGFKESASGLKSLIKTTKTWKLALTAISALSFFAILEGLRALFNNSEEGQNRLAKATKQFGVVLGNVGDVMANFGNLIVATFVDRDLEKIKTAFNDLKDSITNFGDETRKEIEIAGDLADRIAEVNKKERDLLVDREKASGQLERLRTKAAQVDKFNSEERIAFLEQAAAIETAINERQVALAQEKLDIKIAENSLTKSTKEDLDAEAQLRAEVISLENQSLAVKREFYSQISGLRQADMDARAAERQAEIDGFKTMRETLDEELEKSVVRREALQIGSNENVAESLRGLQATKEKNAEDEKALDENVANAKKALAMQGLSLITEIAGKGSAIGKAAAVAQATISGIEGVQNAYTTAQKSPVTAVFPAYPYIQAGLAGAFSALQIKSILSTPKPSVSGGGVSSAAPRAAAPTPPAFNVVGASNESQLAQTIGEREQEPVKAYVVSNDVTTAQSLDRNIVESASIG